VLFLSLMRHQFHGHKQVRNLPQDEELVGLSSHRPNLDFRAEQVLNRAPCCQFGQMACGGVAPEYEFIWICFRTDHPVMPQAFVVPMRVE
jgi:hypothetical protein